MLISLETTSSITVPIARWQDERQALIARGDIGLRLQATESLEAVADDLGYFCIVAIEFASSMAAAASARPGGYLNDIATAMRFAPSAIFSRDQIYTCSVAASMPLSLPTNRGSRIPAGLRGL